MINLRVEGLYKCKFVVDKCVCVLLSGCRQVFERWMEWEPEEQAWHSYINFELRYKELDRARMVYERYILDDLCETCCGDQDDTIQILYTLVQRPSL